jgi:hypothetical protein
MTSPHISVERLFGRGVGLQQIDAVRVASEQWLDWHPLRRGRLGPQRVDFGISRAFAWSVIVHYRCDIVVGGNDDGLDVEPAEEFTGTGTGAVVVGFDGTLITR